MDDPIGTIEKLKESGLPVVFVGDVVGTGSSRKSATSSLLWHIGEDIPFIPNKSSGHMYRRQNNPYSSIL